MQRSQMLEPWPWLVLPCRPVTPAVPCPCPCAETKHMYRVSRPALIGPGVQVGPTFVPVMASIGK